MHIQVGDKQYRVYQRVDKSYYYNKNGKRVNVDKLGFESRDEGEGETKYMNRLVERLRLQYKIKGDLCKLDYRKIAKSMVTMFKDYTPWHANPEDASQDLLANYAYIAVQKSVETDPSNAKERFDKEDYEGLGTLVAKACGKGDKELLKFLKKHEKLTIRELPKLLQLLTNCDKKKADKVCKKLPPIKGRVILVLKPPSTVELQTKDDKPLISFEVGYDKVYTINKYNRK
jgi:hypothetical protein